MEQTRAAIISKETAGLCAGCTNARRIQSNRGSLFILCELSRSDPNFPKYPRLPVLSCSGYAPRAATNTGDIEP
jgi:hypothetical protein